jgi:DNA-binding GntR family transcriptional regulator
LVPVVFDRLSNGSLRGRIAGRVREAILKGDLREGQRIVERELAAQLGASATAVREALIELEMEGFITKKPSAATFVTRLTLGETEQLFAVRRVLECYAIERAAAEATAGQIRELEGRYAAMREAAQAGDKQAFLRADYSWHEAMWSMAGNDYLQNTLKRIVLPIFAFTAIRVVSRDIFDLGEDADSHLPAMLAIERNDPAEARAVLANALDRWMDAIRNYVFADGATHQAHT